MRKLRESMLRILVSIEKRERSKISRSRGGGSEPKGYIENLFLRLSHGGNNYSSHLPLA